MASDFPASDFLEEENVALVYDGGKRCTIFVVDFGEQMFANNTDTKHFRIALKAVRDRINYLCCTGGANELAAIIFINTANTNKDAENVDCIFVHRPVGTLDAEYVKQLDALLASSDLRGELGAVLGTETGTCNWGELLFVCQRMFTYCGVVLRRRQIFFFTVNSDPLMGDESVLRSVRSYVSDLRSRETQLSVCLVDVTAAAASQLNNDEDELNCAIDPFWSELDPDVLQSSSLSRLQNEVMRKDISMRPSATVPMRLAGNGDSNNVILAVGVYCLIKEQFKPTTIPLDADTNEPLEYRTHYVAQTSNVGEKVNGDDAIKNHAEEQMPIEEERFEGEVNFARKIGGVSIVLNRTELEGLRRFDEPGLTVIGFKPLKFLKPSHRMGASKYIFPLDDAIKGSATLYRALFQRCAERELFILARFTEKRNTTPKIVALIPQRRKEGISMENDYRYEGFHLVELPYAEDKRSFEDLLRTPNDVPPPTTPQLDVAKNFVKRLTTNYAPHQFTNPVLQRFYAGLEAMALDLDTKQFEENPHIVDKIRPYYENSALERRVATQLSDLKNAFPQCIADASAMDEKKKQPRGGTRKKVAENVEDDDSALAAVSPPKKQRGRRRKE